MRAVEVCVVCYIFCLTTPVGDAVETTNPPTAAAALFVLCVLLNFVVLYVFCVTTPVGDAVETTNPPTTAATHLFFGCC